MKKLISTLLFVLVCLSGQSQNVKVWNQVATGHANTPYVKVTKVALYEDRTEMSMHIDFVAGQWIRIATNTFLQVDGKQFPVKDATVITLGEQYTMPADTLNFVLTFEPVPQNVKSIDMVEPGGWVVPNIRNAGLLPEGITNTYWRDETTGDWLIGFAPKHVIYKNKVYDIASQTMKKDAYTLTLDDGTTIQVGKMKKGLRSIAVGNGKPATCSPITKATLPDYPTKDTRTGFVDNGYRLDDSATIVGWLKDMPDAIRQQNQEFSIDIENILTNKQETTYAKMDSLGRFTFKLPLFNTSEVFIDWGRSFVNAFMEPGKTYFFLYDFVTGQKLWMGDDVRVQNEMLTHPRSRADAQVPYDQKDVDLIAYWAECDSTRQLQKAHLAALQQSFPTLSQRYIDYIGDYYRMLQGRNMMQARFYAKDRIVPQEYMDYVGREFWRKAPKPYTLYRDFTTMNNDFLSQIVTTKGTDNLPDIFKRFEKEGKVKLTAEESRALEGFLEKVKEVNAEITAAKSEEEQQKIIEAFNNSEMVTTLNALIIKNAGVLNTLGYQQALDVVDSLGCDRPLRDIVLAQRMLQTIDGTRQPLDPEILAFAEENCQLPSAFQVVKSLNDKYLAIQKRDISKSPSLKTADELANMSDGEKILRKIIEPYKGKIILVDIWGTWCGPCKEALSHSQEEYERLKDYDLVYLYLCNRSSDESWKNTIKEYDVLGDNVVHYNLPADQQSAIEHFLSVNAFPTYKLIDRDGTILEVNADPHNLERLAGLLENMK